MVNSVSGIEPGQRQLNGPQTSGRNFRNLSKPQFEMARDDDVAIPMRDGVTLLADVHRPAMPGRYPVLIAASHYPRQIQDLGAPMGFIASHPALSQMIYLEIAYAQKDEAKPFGARWDPKEKHWYFPGGVLPKELERFRPAKAPKGPVGKIILDIPFSYRDVALNARAKWDSEVKACFFEKRPGEALPPELEGFEPKQFSWEEKIQRELNAGAFPIAPAQKSIMLKPHQLTAVEAIFSAYKNGYPGFLLADDVGLGKTFAAWAGILKIVESSHEKWKILIVCPLGVVANWRSSVQWMGTNRWVEEVVILNYERLGKIFEAKPRKGAEKLSKRDLARRGAASEEFDSVLFDESHALKNLSSLRAKFSVKLYGSAKLIYWLSATAGQNPLELGYLALILAKKTGDRALTTKDFEQWCVDNLPGVSRGEFGGNPPGPHCIRPF